MRIFVFLYWITIFLLLGQSGGSSSSNLTASIASTIVQQATQQGQPPAAAAAAAGYAAGYVDPNAYWQQQQQQYGGWQGYGYQGGYGYDPSQQGGAYPAGAYGAGGQMPPQHQPEEDEFELIEHSTPIDVDKLNRELFERNQDLWDAMDEARWCPFNPDNAIPAAKTEENGTTSGVSNGSATAAAPTVTASA